MPSHMKALATLSRTFYTGCNDCRHAFSYEGVSNEAIDLVEAIHNVVMPSHMKELATPRKEEFTFANALSCLLI